MRPEQLDASYVGHRENAAVARSRSSPDETIEGFVRKLGCEVQGSRPVVLQVVEIEEHRDPCRQSIDHVIGRGDASANDALAKEHVVAHRARRAGDHFGDLARESWLARHGDDRRQAGDEGHHRGLDIPGAAGKGALSHVSQSAVYSYQPAV